MSNLGRQSVRLGSISTASEFLSSIFQSYPASTATTFGNNNNSNNNNSFSVDPLQQQQQQEELSSEYLALHHRGDIALESIGEDIDQQASKSLSPVHSQSRLRLPSANNLPSVLSICELPFKKPHLSDSFEHLAEPHLHLHRNNSNNNRNNSSDTSVDLSSSSIFDLVSLSASFSETHTSGWEPDHCCYPATTATGTATTQGRHSKQHKAYTSPYYSDLTHRHIQSPSLSLRLGTTNTSTTSRKKQPEPQEPQQVSFIVGAGEESNPLFDFEDGIDSLAFDLSFSDLQQQQQQQQQEEGEHYFDEGFNRHSPYSDTESASNHSCHSNHYHYHSSSPTTTASSPFSLLLQEEQEVQEDKEQSNLTLNKTGTSSLVIPQLPESLSSLHTSSKGKGKAKSKASLKTSNNNKNPHTLSDSCEDILELMKDGRQTKAKEAFATRLHEADKRNVELKSSIEEAKSTFEAAAELVMFLWSANNPSSTTTTTTTSSTATSQATSPRTPLT